MARKDISEINRLKFYTYLMENYYKFKLHEYIKYVNNISCKKLLRKHNVGLRFYHFFIIDFFDIYKEPYMYMYKEYLNNLFQIIYEIYLSLKGISSREVIKNPLKIENLDEDLIKSICQFGYIHNYFILFYKQSKELLKFKILRLGAVNKFSKKLRQTDKSANYIKGVLNINRNSKNFADIVVGYEDDYYMQRNVCIDVCIRNIKVGYKSLEFSEYEKIAEELNTLTRKACNYTEYRETCHLCQPKPIKKGEIYKKITKTKAGHKMEEPKKVYHTACSRCKTIFKKLADLSNNKKRIDVLKKSVAKYDENKPFNIEKERLIRYNRLIMLLENIAVENSAKGSKEYYELKELINATYR